MLKSAARSTFADSKAVAAALRQDILEGNYAPHSALPSVRDIAERFHVGMRVARNSLRMLVEEGAAYTVNRQGTFVGEPSPRPAARSARLRRVVAIERAEGTRPQYNREAYFHSYQEFLEDRHVEMRTAHLPTASGDADYGGIFSHDVPLRQQGCLLVNVRDAHLLQWLNGKGIPFVVQYFTTYSTEALPEHRSVMVNKVEGAFDATRYLLALGHRRIGFMGTLSDVLAVRQPGSWNVYDGFVAAMRCAALDICPRYLGDRAANDEQEGMALARSYLDRGNLPTAVLAQTDMQAACLLRAAQEREIRVPEELSVIGFDGLDEFANTTPPLTTVNVPRRILGREALQLLLDAAESPEECPQRRILSCQLTVRQSAGPAPTERRDRRS